MPGVPAIRAILGMSFFVGGIQISQCKLEAPQEWSGVVWWLFACLHAVLQLEQAGGLHWSRADLLTSICWCGRGLHDVRPHLPPTGQGDSSDVLA